MKWGSPLSFVALVAIGLATRTAASDEQVPPYETFTIDSAVLKETRRINVYKPPGYAADQRRRYPVLYMLDGGVQEDFPHVTTDADTAIRGAQMRPVLIIGIENTERRRDTTGSTEVAADRKIAPRVGGAAAFRAFIAHELIPRVRRGYRVMEEKGIIGESLAGLFIVETFFTQPELFDTYIALSPSLWWNREELVRKAARRLNGRPQLRAALYLASADEDNIAPAAARLADVLREKAPAGLRWQYEPRPDLHHDNIYRTLSPQVLRTWFALAGKDREPAVPRH